ncbi:MAG: hypothetical protein IJ753_08730 [Bacteroidales bacterium]|nr:hypothetical protein [Bacteroidales bacterium]
MENKILEALSQVPGLVEATKISNEINQEQSKLLAAISERNVHADIPSAEVEKVTKAVEEKVMATKCSLPDTESLTEELADGVLCKVTEAIMSAVEEKIKDTPVKLEHHHTHATTFDIARMAEKAARQWILILSLTSGILLLMVCGGVYWHFNSDMYWAGEYAKIHDSKYTTKEEKEMLWHNAYTVGALPVEYDTNPDYAKAKIKRNKAIIEQRQQQANKNKGRYSTTPTLEK